EAGMLLQRCWIAAHASGFACVVHAAICEVAHLREMAQATLMPEATVPLAIFRLGKLRDAGHWTRPHASRPAVRDLLLSPV
ncbi:MAG TPA: hypothetical protein VG963_05715, partial [Polyangiaceae bacterium]|nr:hypothetical protein [Polyangiaceae bacterium]